MPYAFSDFTDHLPAFHRCIQVDPETEEALHAARWPKSAFASFEDFYRFTWRYSCISQPYICRPDRDDLEEWFQPDPGADQGSAQSLEQSERIDSSAKEWMDQFYPGVSIDWLGSGSPGQLLSFAGGDHWPEMCGWDQEGYYTVFVADAT